MGNKSSGEKLLEANNRAADRLGKSAVSARYKRLPKRLEDDYVVEATVLGTGYNGSVFKATHINNGGKYAVKGFHLSGVTGEKLQQLESEAEIFLSMDHPHVARLVDVYESETHLHLVMECMEGGELFERLSTKKRFTEVDASHAVWQMLLAVNYIHSRGVVHRDLKLENFLYERNDSDHLKLIDFGFSHIWEPNTKMALSCGTLAYVAPEVLKKSYTSKCDLWSTGVILFILLAGYMPFSGTEKSQRQAITGGKYSWRPERWKGVSSDAIDLVKKLLEKDPTARLSAEEALSHPFILKHDRKNDDCVDQGVAEALLTFSKASQFRRACMSVMAWSLTNEERAQVRDMFIAMDTSKQGTITMSELKECLTKKFAITDKSIQPIFEALDTSQNEEIHYSEFLAAMCSTRIAMHDDLLKTTFQRFDVDNSGFITLDNLRTVLGESFSGAEVDKLIQEADVSKDGKISYEEFIAFLKDGNVDENFEEAAGKIIDTEMKKPQTAPVGSLSWMKDAACGLLIRGGQSSSTPGINPASSMQVNSSQSQMGTQSMDVKGSATASDQKQPLKANQEQSKQSQCCAIA